MTSITFVLNNVVITYHVVIAGGCYNMPGLNLSFVDHKQFDQNNSIHDLSTVQKEPLTTESMVFAEQLLFCVNLIRLPRNEVRVTSQPHGPLGPYVTVTHIVIRRCGTCVVPVWYMCGTGVVLCVALEMPP